MHPESYPATPTAADQSAIADQDDQDVRYVLTQRGLDLLARWEAERWLFGREVS